MRSAAALLLLFAASSARGERAHATFALIVGVNQGVDPELPSLRYADDDAAQYLELFRTLGARTYLLARPDENSRRLHPQALAEARPPRREELERAAAALARDVQHAQAQGVATEVFFAYAGHGNVKDGEGYLSLEDARLTGKDLKAELVDRIPAARIHFVIDACYSFFVAYGRGPGGQRRPLEPGFSQAMQLSSDERVGLLLSTSSARESHEWEGFQSGVFSHEVRSGLWGAADVDGDRAVSYREIAAFVQRANASIPNERFRPDVWARAPKDGDRFVDLRRALKRRLEIDGEHAARYLLEDSRGVRLADFHSGKGQPLQLLRPLMAGESLFLRRLPDQAEFAVAHGEDVLALAAIAEQPPRVRQRGAAHESFQKLFELPFDRTIAAEYRFPHREPERAPELKDDIEDRPLSPFQIAGIATCALAAASAGAGLGTYLSARSEREGVKASDPQADVAARNARIRTKSEATTALLVGAGAAAVTGTFLVLWPPGAPRITVVPGSGGAMALVSGRF